MSRTRVVRAGPCGCRAGLVGPGAGHPGRGQHRRRRDLGRGRAGAAAGRWAWRAGLPGGTPSRAARAVRRAADATGGVQPVEQPWNRAGMANNMAQRVEVICAE